MRYFILIFTFCFSLSLNAQDEKAPLTNLESIQQLEDTLVVLGYGIVNDSTPVKRFAACQKFIKTMVQALKHENSFDYPFDRVTSVSIQYAPDSTFRIFSWQLYVDINEYRYYGTIQMNEPKLKMFPLIDRSEEVMDPYMDILSADKWYGSLIYNIKAFDTPKGEKKYLLFGFDGYRFFTKRKLIDVLTFKEGKPLFGDRIFELEDGKAACRFIQEYGSDARVKLNWNDDLNMIIFDHLVLSGSPYKGQESMYIPDGDIDGLKLEKGYWKYQKRIYDQVLEEAPRPEPVLNAKGRTDQIDLFGN